MKTYTVLYAEDVPHYGTREFEAADDALALQRATDITPEAMSKYTGDPDHSQTLCRRIVHIEDPDGKHIAADVPLDEYTLIHGKDKGRICEAAPALLKALETIAAIPLWGEPIADPDLKAGYSEAAEYDLELDEFNPSGDTESTYLRDAVEAAREALKTVLPLPSKASAQEGQP